MSISPQRGAGPRAASRLSSRLRLADDNEWVSQAACKAHPNPDLWYPEADRARSSKDEQVLAAKAICRTCPVTDNCLEYALDVREPAGIYGGCTAAERLVLLRIRSKQDHERRLSS